MGTSQHQAELLDGWSYCRASRLQCFLPLADEQQLGFAARFSSDALPVEVNSAHGPGLHASPAIGLRQSAPLLSLLSCRTFGGLIIDLGALAVVRTLQFPASPGPRGCYIPY